MTKEQLRTTLGFSPSTMAKMSKGKYVSLEVVHKICESFNAQPNGIMEFIPDKQAQRKLDDIQLSENEILQDVMDIRYGKEK